MTFKVGDVVRISALGRESYPEEDCNPYDESGRVDDLQIDGWVGVMWFNGVHNSYYEDELELVTEAPTGASNPHLRDSIKELNVGKSISDGGPAAYYDWPSGWVTLNDYIEYKSLHQWKEHSFHWGNVTKALCRWGDKEGTTVSYDAKKIIYSGCRVLKALVGVEQLRAYLQSLLDDPQFQAKE